MPCVSINVISEEVPIKPEEEINWGIVALLALAGAGLYYFIVKR